MSKVCKTKSGKGCNTEKQLECFRKSGKYYRSLCKECEYQYIQLHRNNNKDKVKEWSSNYYQKNKEKIIKKVVKYQREVYNKTFQRKYQCYKNSASRRKYIFELTLKDFIILITDKKCFFCNKKCDKMGIDRIENTIGYKNGNVIPCCKDCNMMKGKLSYQQFIKLCSMISKTHRNNINNLI